MDGVRFKLPCKALEKLREHRLQNETLWASRDPTAWTCSFGELSVHSFHKAQGVRWGEGGIASLRDGRDTSCVGQS